MEKFDENFKSFEKKCETAVKKDKIKGGVYLGPLVLTKTPNYCLVGKEPSQRNDTKEKIKQGYKNFLSSKQDFILNYCAFNYLCGGKFAYVITDLSKNAMKIKLAKKDAVKRYRNWKNLFEEEIKIYGRPIIISVGNPAIFNKLDLKYHDSVLHYSVNNIKNVRRYFDLNPDIKINRLKNLKDNLSNFSKILLSLKSVGYSQLMISSTIDRVYKRELTEYDYMLHAYYKNRFNFIPKRLRKS